MILAAISKTVDTPADFLDVERPSDQGEDLLVTLLGNAALTTRENHPDIGNSRVLQEVIADIPARIAAEQAVDNSKIGLEIVDQGRAVVLTVGDLQVEIRRNRFGPKALS
jgi:hypothetical protein